MVYFHWDKMTFEKREYRIICFSFKKLSTVYNGYFGPHFLGKIVITPDSLRLSTRMVYFSISNSSCGFYGAQLRTFSHLRIQGKGRALIWDMLFLCRRKKARELAKYARDIYHFGLESFGYSTSHGQGCQWQRDILLPRRALQIT